MRDLAQSSLWLIPLLPLLGFVVNGLVGKRLPKAAVAGIACLLPAGSCALSVIAALALRESREPIVQQAFTWIQTGGLTVPFALRVDELTAVMLLVVTGVGTLIHIYSIGYMHEDPGFARFFSYLNLFMFAMLVLVLGDNLLLMFVGWEGVGLCSYLLIGFWYDDLKNADAGKKAFITNRIGDFGFILGTLLLLGLTGTLSFADMKGRIDPSSPLLWWAAMLLALGAAGKSAQIPLYVWLPDAMAGPTPVSALIHAATMVTAGVYMMGRMHFLYSAVPGAMEIIVLVAAATALLAAVIAVAQTDIKKILAYSTISQLGFMFAGMASAHYLTGIFHLGTHAFFKALLFLGAGAVIHALHGEQDIRKMGGLAKSLPGVFAVFVCGAVALMGCPGSAGFYSKDMIIAAVSMKTSGAFAMAHLMLLGTAFLTAFYTMRMVVIAFFGAPSGHAERPHAPGITMMAPLVVLALLSVFGGFLLGQPLEHVFAGMWPAPDAHKWEAAHHGATTASTVAFAFGAGLAFLVYGLRREWAQAFVEGDLGRRVHWLVSNRFFVDEIYQWTIVAPVRMSAAALWFVVDRVIIDAVLVNGSARAAYWAGGRVRRGHTGAIAAGAAAIMVGVLGSVGWLVYKLIVHG